MVILTHFRRNMVTFIPEAVPPLATNNDASDISFFNRNPLCIRSRLYRVVMSNNCIAKKRIT